MAADMNIHVLEGDCTESDLVDFFSSTFGSKHFGRRGIGCGPAWDAAYKKIAKTPSVHVGEVSWLKAAVTGDSEEFVPNVVQAVSKVIGEDLPVVDETLIDRIGSAWGTKPNAAAKDYDVADRDTVVAFLREHMGKRVFTVSW